MTEAESKDVPKYLQENELSQECKDLIATIPKEKGWVASHLHQYQGFWHTTRQLQGVLSCQNHFQANDSDILIVSTPKSGTTWLKAWTFALLNRHKYPNMTQNHPLLIHNPHFLVPFLELDLYINTHTHTNSLPNLTSYSSPRLFSTHLPYISLPNSVAKSSCKMVYLCRDPKDAFISLWHFTNKLRLGRSPAPLEEVFDKFCRGVSLSGPFWDHVSGYWRESTRYPHRIMLIKFEDMKSNAGLVLKQVAEFVGCPISKEEEEEGVVERILELCSFENLSNLKVNKNGKLKSGEEHKAFFRRGEIGDWKNHLIHDMIQKIDSITQEKLGQHGFTF